MVTLTLSKKSYASVSNEVQLQKRKDIQRFLSEIPYLNEIADIKPKLFSYLVDNVSHKVHKKNQCVFTMGEEVKVVYFVQRGEVEVSPLFLSS